MEGYQLKIVVKNSKPPIWRRIIVCDELTFEQLHRMIQKLFGLEDEHMYQFNVEGLKFERDEFCRDGECLSAEWTLGEYVFDVKKFTYWYDFGDDWLFDIFVEKECEEVSPHPTLIKAKGGYLAEDVGGIYGYYQTPYAKTVFDFSQGQADINDILPKDYISEDVQKEVSVIMERFEKKLLQRMIPQYTMYHLSNNYLFMHRYSQQTVLFIFNSLKDMLDGIYRSRHKGFFSLYVCCLEAIFFHHESADANIQGKYAVYYQEPGMAPQVPSMQGIQTILEQMHTLESIMNQIDFSRLNDQKILEYQDQKISYEPLKTDIDITEYTGICDKTIQTKIKSKQKNLYVGIAILPESVIKHPQRLEYIAVVTDGKYDLQDIIIDDDFISISTLLQELIVTFINEYGRPKNIFAGSENIAVMLKQFCRANRLNCLVKDIGEHIQKVLDYDDVDDELEDFVEGLLDKEIMDVFKRMSKKI